MNGWREWVHVPWHCPYCLTVGFMVGQAVTVIVFALGVAYGWR